MEKWIFINEEFVKEEKASLKVNDLALTRGYGIFDFLKVINALPLFINDHLDRLYNSATKMHLPIPARQELEEIIEQLIEKNQVTECGIRIILTGGYSPDGYKPAQPNLVVSTHPIQIPGRTDIERGIRLMTWPFQRQLPDVKTIDYLMAIWLQPELKRKGADDVLYVNNNIISECPRANIFIVSNNNRIITPAHNILKGITRKKILQIASPLFQIEERDISLNELEHAQEIFICSTTKNILPVSQVNEFILPQKNPVTIQLLQMLSHKQSPEKAPVTGK